VRDPFLGLCSYTFDTLRHLHTVYPRDPARLEAGLAGRSLAQVRVQFRPEAPVRVKPWGAYGRRNLDHMMDWLEGKYDSDPSFVMWSVYLQQYAEAELTGRVVEILPRSAPVGPMEQLPSSGRPMSYLVRFPKLLPWFARNSTAWGPSPFAPEEDVSTGDPVDIPVPPGGWRLSRTGATRAQTQGRPAGSSDHGQGAYMELEVPYYRLYVDVAAAEAQGMNPFRADIMVGNLHQRGLGDEEAEEELRAYDHGCG